MSMSQNHPALDDLAALAEGRLQGPERREVVEHLVQCEECYTIFAQAARLIEESTPAPIPAAGTRSRPVLFLAAACIAIAVIISSALLLNRPRPSDDVTRVALAAGREHPVRFRLSGGVVPGQLTMRGNAQAGNDDLLQVYLDLKKNGGTQPEHFHALGNATLLLGRADEAIGLLKQASARQAEPAALNDLAAALLYRFEQSSSPGDLKEADSATSRALALNADQREAIFNRAQIRQLEGDRNGAIAAWKRYLSLDSSGSWADLAKRQLEVLSAPTSTELWRKVRPRLVVNAAPAFLKSAVDAHPQEVRLLIEEELLPEWGEHRDPAVLALSHALAGFVALRGDALSVDTIAQIEHGSPKVRATIATSLVKYGRARRAMKKGEHAAAAGLLKSALQLASQTRCIFALRCRIATASNEVYQGSYEAALSEANAAWNSEARMRSYSAADAQIQWLRGLCLLTSGRTVEALAAYRAAALEFRRLGESENEAAVRDLLAEALDYAGEPSAAERSRVEALTALMRLGDSVRLPVAINEAADSAMRRGDFDRAIALQSQLREMADRTDDPVLFIHASVHMSEAFWHEHAIDAANKAAVDAQRRLPAIADQRVRNRLQPQVDVALLRGDPQATDLRAYDKLVSELAEEDNHYVIAAVLREKAERLAAARRYDEAWAALRDALSEVEYVRERVNSVVLRAEYHDTAAAIVDSSLAVLIAAGRPDEALAVLQDANGRTLRDRTVPVPAKRDLGPPAHQMISSVPSGSVAISYRSLDDRLLIWAIRDGEAVLAQVLLTRARLGALVRMLHDSYERRQPAPFNAAATALGDVLFGSVQRQLAGARSLIIVPDAETASIPFAALRIRGRYIIELFPVEYSPSLAAGGRRLNRSGALTSASLFANPTLSGEDATRFPPLPNAVNEARAIASLYPRATLHVGAAAGREAFDRATRSSNLLHIASHTIDNTDAPFLSAILLAGDRGRVRADEIARSDVRCRLVVLAGCSTSAGARSSIEGTNGLAAAFLAGGAQAVLASCWPVADEPTSDFMMSFYRALHSGSQPAEALRLAQLRVLADRNDALAWVPFQLLISTNVEKGRI